jgi:hypothetical protein
LRSVPGSSGVYPAAPAPRHNTPPLTQTHPTAEKPPGWHFCSSWTSCPASDTVAAAAAASSDTATSQPGTPEANTQDSICAAYPPYARFRTFPRTMRNIVACTQPLVYRLLQWGPPPGREREWGAGQLGAHQKNLRFSGSVCSCPLRQIVISDSVRYRSALGWRRQRCS